MTTMKTGSVFALMVFLLLLLPHVARASAPMTETLELTLRSGVLQSGITIKNKDRSFLLGVQPQLTNGPAVVRAETVAIAPASPKGTTLRSAVWHCSLLPNAKTPDVVPVLQRSLTVAIRGMGAQQYHRQHLMVWDATKEKWVVLPTASNTDAQMYRTSIQKMDFIIALFEDDAVVEGQASWFRHKYIDTAASNDFPIGSKLRVTNLENNKKVDVVVRSTGPFKKGRVIDMAKTAFKKLASISTGIIHNVRVELIALPT